MQKIDPWGSNKIENYEHVFRKFGLAKFPDSVKKKLDHIFFERNIVIAHRDFEKVLKRVEGNGKFINITGIASSGPFHLGHKADIDLFRFFKKKGAVNYFCVCDLDAYSSRLKIKTLSQAREIAVDNTAHALALGLDPKDIFVQSNREKRYYSFAFELGKKITAKTFEAIYGHLDLGKVSANLLQYSDILHGQLSEYSGKMPSITGIGLDQDPHARATRDLVKRLPYDLEVPSFVYFRHQSGLKEGSKMSASQPDTAVFLDDSPKDAERKIKRAFSGGRPTVEEHRKQGGVLAIDKVYEMLLFHYPNSRKLNKIAEDFSSGKMLSSELKQIAVDFFSDFLEKHRQKVDENKKLAREIVYGK